MNEKGVDIIIADDHPLFRKGLSTVLSKIPSIGKIQQVANGAEVIDLLSRQHFDLVMMDIRMPVMDGITTTREIRQSYVETNVIALTMSDEEYSLIRMFEAGARGYLLKSAATAEITDAIHAVIAGQYYYDKTISSVLLQQLQTKELPAADGQQISDREKEILLMLCEEMTTEEIAEKLSISSRTVSFHRDNLLRKTEAKNLAGIVRFAVRNGLIKP